MALGGFYFQQPFCEIADGCRVREIDPPADLARHVAKIVQVRIVRPYVRLCVPDGCFTLGVGVHHQRGKAHSFLVGPGHEWAHGNITEGWTYIEARFRWGMGASFLGVSPQSAPAHTYEVEDILGKHWRYAMEQIADSKSIQDASERLVFTLREMSAKASKVHPGLEYAVRQLERSNSSFSVDDLARTVCMSSSQLRRLFAAEHGLSPRESIRLKRLWSAMSLSVQCPVMSWAEISAEANYFDQAHLVDDFRHFTGSTPQQWKNALKGVETASQSA